MRNFHAFGFALLNRRLMIVVKILQALFISLSDPSEVVLIILSGRFEASPNGHVIFNRDVLTRK